MWLTGGVYQEWAFFLDQWSAGQDPPAERLPVIDPETLTPDTVERLNARVSAALQARLDLWSRALLRDWNASRDEFSAGRSLTQARDGLRAIKVLTRHPSLPEDARRLLGGTIDRAIESCQLQMEQQLDRQLAGGGDRRVVERLRRVVRENALTAVITEDPRPIPPPAPVVTGRPTRRVLLG